MVHSYQVAPVASRLSRFTGLIRGRRFHGRTTVSDLPGLSAVSQSVLDAICNLRAIDDGYGIGDGYFGQPLRPIYNELPGLTPGEILETVASLLATGYLRGSRHNPGLVWVTNQGWLNWTSWDHRNEFLLRHSESTD